MIGPDQSQRKGWTPDAPLLPVVLEQTYTLSVTAQRKHRPIIAVIACNALAAALAAFVGVLDMCNSGDETVAPYGRSDDPAL